MNNFFIFAAGAAIGSLVTWKLVKGKYKRIANEEIESVKEVFSRRYSEKNENLDTNECVNYPKPTPEEVSEYKNVINSNGYSSVERIETMHDKPYVIPPEDFGDDPNYKTVSLTLYADGVLTDENNHVINPGRIDDLIGEDSLDHFGEYEDDSVFVRNEAKETDYEILLDMKKFMDSANNHDD